MSRQLFQPISWFHGNYVHGRRVDVLAAHLADLISKNAKVLDVGCGDGLLSSAILERRPDLDVVGIDVLVRPETSIPVEAFDGSAIPYQDETFDSVIAVDVLHHTVSPPQLLAEMARVTRKQIVLKDHYRNGLGAQWTLAWMDRVGNARHGVDIPCNYLSRQQWGDLFSQLGLEIDDCRQRLGLYPPPLKWWFERGLHFVASLRPKQAVNLGDSA